MSIDKPSVCAFKTRSRVGISCNRHVFNNATEFHIWIGSDRKVRSEFFCEGCVKMSREQDLKNGYSFAHHKICCPDDATQEEIICIEIACHSFKILCP